MNSTTIYSKIITTLLLVCVFLGVTHAQWVESQFPLSSATEGEVFKVTHDEENNIYALLYEMQGTSKVKKYDLFGNLIWSKIVDFTPDEMFTNNNNLVLAQYDIYELNILSLIHI